MWEISVFLRLVELSFEGLTGISLFVLTILEINKARRKREQRIVRHIYRG
jgi:hypothetical protein